ncbi:Frag1/DRAM/Sfk1 family-domain-containing protein [Mucidula mucida]|nr:Frag1/DRAM/Sfk1 family-domain-containing protein [Mucidula mucida]
MVDRRHPTILSASLVARAHTYLAYSAFGTALVLGLLLHYKKIVKNGVAGYPKEWFPSVSATIGDWYPERNVFQILIALASGPRFGLVALQYYLHRSKLLLITGLVRTLSCGGFVYITSSDDHDVHDICMITYMLCNIPWMLGGIWCTQNSVVRKRRQRVATAFFVSLFPLVYFFVQHKVHRVPGAYTRYSFFEWGLIFLDVLYDSLSEREFKDASLQVSLSSFSSIEQSTTANDEMLSKIAHASQPFQVTDSKLSQSSVFESPTMSFVCDLYLAYIFWSIFTSLIPTLFYFSVWQLGIAGHEVAFLAVLSPFLFAVLPSDIPESLLHLLSFSGLAAFGLNKTLQRLFVVAFASLVAVLRQTAAWANPTADTAYQAILTGLGLMLASLSKHVNHSNNPVWPSVNASSGGWNKTGLGLAFLALLQFSLRPRELRAETLHPIQPARRISLLSAALPLGSLLFVLHNFFSDPSSIIAWSWTGYEDRKPRGPLPHLHGSLTLLFQALGLLLSCTSISSHLIFMHVKLYRFLDSAYLLFGAGCLFVLHSVSDWTGYLGGLGYALFAMSLFPRVVQNAAVAATTHSVAMVYGTAMLVYVLLSLASVWTVAYAFVPGGVYLRERTDLVLMVQLLCLVPAFTHVTPRHSMALGTYKKLRVLFTVALISTVAVLATLYRLPTSPVQPFRSGHRMVRAGIWTIHFGLDNKGRDSQRRVAKLIRDMELDVVGLLETDLHRQVFGNRDLTRVILEDGYYADIGPGPNKHTWGAVLLSKFPIVNSTHHLLPSPHGELAPAIEAVLDMYGTMVTVVVSHNGQEEDPLDRELQSTELARIMAEAYPRPVIFLGYVVTKPLARRPSPYEILVHDGNVDDVDEEDSDRWCEYILYRGLYRTSYARVSRGSVTDTELQVAQFVLPKYGTTVVDDSFDARYVRVNKEILSEEHWFPMEYYGSKKKGGVNGHFYHVFNTPLYYNIPEGALL